MVNEFNEQLDRNGYAQSIMQFEDHCFICYRNGPKARHEVFHGPLRKKAKRLGLWVNLCPLCHYEVHNGDGKLDLILKRNGQSAAMSRYNWSVDEFRWNFGKNYLEDEDG